jgi:NADPH:quinone reductase-like Zn-dependent oxidoreductase
VLISGAAGSVGSVTVQIAAALGAEVTGVCSTGNSTSSVRSAPHTDYTKDDFIDGRVQYDMVHDNVGNHPLHRLRRALTPTETSSPTPAVHPAMSSAL